MSALARRWSAVPEKWLVLADQIGVSGAAFATNLLLARALGLADYGRFSAILLGQLLLLSIQQAGGMGVYQVCWAATSARWRGRYTNSVLWGHGVWLAALLLLGFATYQLDFAGLSDYKAVAPAVALATTFYLAQDALRRMLLTQQQAGRALLLNVLTNTAQLAGLCLMWWRGELTLTVAWWLIGATFVPTVALGLCWLKPHWPRRRDLALTLRWHRRQGGWMILSAGLQWSAGNYFLVAGGWWLGAATLGALRLAQYIFGLLNVVLQAVESYVTPRAAGLPSPALTPYLTNVLKKMLLAVAPLLLGLVVFAGPLLAGVGGEPYRPYAYLMQGLACLYVLVVVGYPVRIALRVRGLTKHYFVGYVLATAFSLSAAPWMVASGRAVGVLAGMFASQAILLLYWGWILTRNTVSRWTLFTLFSARPTRPE